MLIELESGLRFQLDKSTSTATVVTSPLATGHVQIPRTISDLNGVNYIITTIGVESFKDNKNIQDIILPDDSGLTSIEAFAFSNSSVRKINFPACLEHLDAKCFEGADNLVEIEVSDSNQIYEYLDNKYLIQKQKEQTGDILIFGRRDLKKAVIPSNIIKIAPRAFLHCRNLKIVSFDPNGCILKEIGKRAFSKCTSLDTIQPFPPSVNLFFEYSFSDLEKLVRVEFHTESLILKKDCFFNCKELSLASFPYLKKLNIDEMAFNKVSPHFVKLMPPDAEIEEI